MEHLSDFIARHKFNFSNEKELQAGIGKVFAKIDEKFEPEYYLSKEDIIDFYWPDKKIGVEIKINHPLSHLTRQLHRYVQHENVMGILLVTSMNRLTRLPGEINKKPIICHNIIGSLL